jgi:hypothetical protein
MHRAATEKSDGTHSPIEIEDDCFARHRRRGKPVAFAELVETTQRILPSFYIDTGTTPGAIWASSTTVAA